MAERPHGQLVPGASRSTQWCAPLSRECIRRWSDLNSPVMQGKNICAQTESERVASSLVIMPVGPCMCCLSILSRHRRPGHRNMLLHATCMGSGKSGFLKGHWPIWGIFRIAALLPLLISKMKSEPLPVHILLHATRVGIGGSRSPEGASKELGGSPLSTLLSPWLQKVKVTHVFSRCFVRNHALSNKSCRHLFRLATMPVTLQIILPAL